MVGDTRHGVQTGTRPIPEGRGLEGRGLKGRGLKGRGLVGDRVTMLQAARLALWSVAHFLFYFIQQIAELVAPLLLVLGLGWWALPKLVAAITTHEANADQQTRDILDTVAGTIPHGLYFAGHWITPGGLIFDGLLLMALAAIGSTLSALAAREM